MTELADQLYQFAAVLAELERQRRWDRAILWAVPAIPLCAVLLVLAFGGWHG